MKKKLKTEVLIHYSAVISLGTYLLVTVARWFQPALFTPAVSVSVLLTGMILLIVSLSLDLKSPR